MIIKMNKNTLWLSLVGLLIIVGIVITIKSNPGKETLSSGSDENLSNSLAINNSTSSQQQIATMGAVDIDVEPIKLGITGEKNIFSVSFNTHSVELDFDFTEIITLEDDLGNIYKALEWTGNSGWHHVSGDIIFPSINKEAKTVILTISEIESLVEKFEWKVK